MGEKIDLVLGISSVGKSTYILRRHDAAVRAILASDITPCTATELLDGGPCVVHYNMLRPHDNDADLYECPLQADPVLALLTERRSRIAGTVLVARPSTIFKRILLRDGHEPVLRPTNGHLYPTRLIFDFVCRIPISAIYERWFEFLVAQSINFRILSAEDDTFSPVEHVDAARCILASKDSSAYTEEETRIAVSRFSFAYQRFDAIAGCDGDGADRNPTLDAIHPHVTGSTALDIGCGPGFFCFALEKMGFRQVVGTEVKTDRFHAACAIKQVTGSQCEFLLRDIFANPLQRSFDTVLMLNVLHHLSDPVGALEQVARICKQRLIIEFATLADEKFTRTCPEPPQIGEEMPLIGVSLLPSEDQTFLFSPEALRRICLDHRQLFRSIKFLPSPLSPARRLAICMK